MKEASFVGRISNAPARSRFTRLRRHAGVALAALLALAAFLALAASPASALTSAKYTGVSFGPDGTSETNFSSIQSVAVDQTNGDVYVYDGGAAKVYKFNASGAPKNFSGLKGNAIENVGGAGGGEAQIAVDSSNGPTAGLIYVATYSGGVNIYSPAGAGLGSLGGGCGVASVPSGRLFVGVYYETVNEYTPTGSVPTAADKTGTSNPSAGLTGVCNVGADGLGNVYVATYSGGLKKLTGGLSASSASPFDPSASTLAVDPFLNEVYANQGNSIVKYDAAGNFLVRFADSGPGALSDSRGVGINTSTGQPNSKYVYAARTSGKVGIYAPYILPSVTTGPPSFVDHEAATVTGTVNPSDSSLPVTCEVEYGTSTSYGLSVPCQPGAIPGGTSDVAVTAELTGLTTLTTYHYRVVTTNANGTSTGADREVTAAAVRGVATNPATNIGRANATFNGTLDPDGAETSYYFEYGVDTSYGQKFPLAPADAGSASGVVPVAQNVVGLLSGTTYHYRIVATNSTGTSFGEDQSFATQIAVNAVTTGPATDVDLDSATLSGSLDPDGIETQFYFEWGPTTTYGQKAPIPAGNAGSGSGSTPVSAELANLEAGTTYHYRLVGTNSTGASRGADQSFSTTQAPNVVSFSADHITATSAELHARINPNGFATTYRFEYGPTKSYGNSLPVPDGELGPLSTPQEVTVNLSELNSNVIYHFRVVASSVYGTVTTDDQTFSYYPPNCPNAEVRQQTGASALPDCRAYELVSPGQMGAIVLLPGGPNSGYATNPPRFAYFGLFGVLKGAGAPPNGFGDLYVSTRSPTGWTSKYVGIPGAEALEVSGPPMDGPSTGGIAADPQLNTVVDWDAGLQGFEGPPDVGSNAPYLWGPEGQRLGRLPTNLDSVPNGREFRGDPIMSGDFTHFAFSSGLARNHALGTPVFAPGGLEVSPGSAYLNNRETGAVSVISITPEGDPIPVDESFQRYTEIQYPEVSAEEEYIEFPAISKDGSNVLMSTRAESRLTGSKVHLYMRANNTDSYEPSKGVDGINHGVIFRSMTSDGSQVFFTTDIPMTADDHDTGLDLFVWREATDSLTRVSQGGSSGDTDGCSATWTSRCDIGVVEPEGSAGGFSTSPTKDNFTTDAGEIYFYSPEQLDGARGLFNRRNLYLYRDGQAHFVATLGDDKPLTRIQTTPNGKRVAFVTGSRLTSFDNAGFAQMYYYDPVGQKITCVSCDPEGKTPTSDVKGSQSGLFMSLDGRTFFDTADSLVLSDSNGRRDVYEFVEGRPQLISSGLAGRDSGFATAGLQGVSANGVDVYFSTYDTLVAEDDNGPFLKFYDARTAGGFLTAPDAAPCAAADECHGPGSTPPAVPSFGSDVQLGNSGNFKPQAKKHKKKSQKKKRKGKKKSGQGKGKKSKVKADKTGRTGR